MLRRIDSPVPLSELSWPLWPLPTLLEGRDEAHVARRDVPVGASPHLRPARPMLRLPIAMSVSQPAPLGHRPQTPLTQHLMAVSATHYETFVSWDDFDAMLERIWHDVQPRAVRDKACRARLLRADDDAALYLALLPHSPHALQMDAEGFAWSVGARLRRQHYTIVIECAEAFIATASLLIERSLTASHELIGHLDDIYVAADWQHAHLDASLTDLLMTFGDELGVEDYGLS